MNKHPPTPFIAQVTFLDEVITEEVLAYSLQLLQLRLSHAVVKCSILQFKHKKYDDASKEIFSRRIRNLMRIAQDS